MINRMIFVCLLLALSLTLSNSALAQGSALPPPPSQETLDRLEKMGDENLKKYGPGTTTATKLPTITATASAQPTATASAELPPNPEKISFFNRIINYFVSFQANLKAKIIALLGKDTDLKQAVTTEDQKPEQTEIKTQSPSPSVQPTKVAIVSATTKPLATTVSAPPATITWSSRLISWSDFVGQPNVNDPELAKIALRIAAQSKLSESCSTSANVQCTVTISGFLLSAQMDTKQSYVVPGAETAARLNHEQTHFDLTEGYVRRLRNALNPYLGRSETAQGATINEAFEIAASKLDALVNPIVIQYQDEHHQEQIRYDNETNHSLNQSAQSSWDAKVDAMLN